MNRQLVFFLLVFIWGSVLSFMMAGEVSVAATTLAAYMNASDTSMTVVSTSGFLSTNGRIVVDSEIMAYTGSTDTTFTGLRRGQLASDPSSHVTGTNVYSETSGFLNKFVTFNVAETLADDGFIIGSIRSVIGVAGMFVNGIAMIVTWDFAFLEGHGAWVKYLLLYPLSAGLVVSFVSWVFRRA